MAINLNATSNSSSSSYKVNAISGMNSGLDTEAIVDAMTSNIQTKIDRNKQDTQVYQWKQEAYRDITEKVEGFYDQYFKYQSSSDSITNSRFFDETYCNSSSSDVSVTGSTLAMSSTVIKGGSIQLATNSSLTTTHQLAAGNLSGSLDTSRLRELAGTTMTFSYNGVSKTVTFDESDADTYSDADGFVSYLNGKLDVAFGTGKVSAALTTSGAGTELSFGVSDSSSVFKVSSASDGVLGNDGILGMTAGASNKIDVSTMRLSSIAGLTPDSEGNYTLNVNGKEFTFAGTKTLGNVMAEVNASSDAGAVMSFSSVTNTFSLLSKNTGAESEIRISGSLADAMFGTAESGERVNSVGKDFQAEMSFDGGASFHTVIRSSNAFTLDGAEYSFTGVGDGKDITFESGTNTDAIVDKVKAFVEAYNSIMSEITKQTSAKKYGEDIGSGNEYLPLTDAQRAEMSEKEIEQWEEKAKTGLLRNDSTLQNIASRLRSAMTSMVGDKALYQYGIDVKSWSDKGVLTIDEDKLRAQVASDPSAVSELFTGENGIASKVKSVLTYAVKGSGSSNGVLVDLAGSKSKSTTDTNNTISRRIDSLKEALTALETKLETKKEYWWNKFTYLESYISSMNSQSTFLSSFSA